MDVWIETQVRRFLARIKLRPAPRTVSLIGDSAAAPTSGFTEWIDELLHILAWEPGVKRAFSLSAALTMSIWMFPWQSDSLVETCTHAEFSNLLNAKLLGVISKSGKRSELQQTSMTPLEGTAYFERFFNFEPSANFVLQSECKNHHEVLDRAVDCQWHLASRSKEFDQVVDAVHAGAITCHACPLKQADVIVDNVGALDAVVSESAKEHTTTSSDIDAVSMISFAVMWVRSAGELAEEAHDVIRSCRFGRVDAPAMERALTETEKK